MPVRKDKQIVVQALDGKEKYSIPYGDIELSTLFKNIIKDMVYTGEETIMLVDDENISSETLKVVLTYMADYNTHGKINELSPDEWERKYIDFGEINSDSIEKLFDLAHAANFLDIKPMFDLLTREIVQIIEKNTVPRIRELFRFNQ